MATRGRLYTISAPSGAGKTSLVKALVSRDPQVRVSISHTTRAKRQVEEDGRDYYFVDQHQFKSMLKDGAFLEHANVFQNSYGTSRQWVEDALSDGQDIVLEIDWQGAEQVRHLMPDTQSIFILPPCKLTLEQRLRHRGQDDDTVIQRRMQEALSEMSHYAEAHWLIINDVFDKALDELCSILTSQRITLAAQQQKCEPLLSALLSS